MSSVLAECELMLPVAVQTFYATSVDVQKIRGLIERGQGQFPADSLVTDQDKSVIINILGHLNAELQKFDCRAAMASVRKIAAAMDSSTLDYGGAILLFDEMDGRIRDELETSFAFTLTAQEARLFSPVEPLVHPDFPQKFESAEFDAEECAKCLALGRSTAAVFHAMRILEKGIYAISRCLNVPDPVKASGKSWAFMLRNIDDAIKAKWPDAADRETGDGHLFESLFATLSAIRNPWRNKTMHPAQKYTEQEAARIVNVVGNFMEELTQRCDERGEPKA